MTQYSDLERIRINRAEQNPVLDLSKATLFDLPSELGESTHLVELRLDGGRFRRLDARVLKRLTKLKVLSAVDCYLTTFPDGVAYASSLEEVDFRRNSIVGIASGIGRMRGLKSLDLSGNDINSVVPELGTLNCLERLDLSRNRLTSFPGELGFLSSDILLKIDGNPLTSPIKELAERGTEPLFSYLASSVGGEPAWESKCVLIGEGNVGKTSILEALRGEPFVESRPTTHGIEVRTFNIPHPVEPETELTIRAWDFGGQPIYRVTHQFFLTRSAVYVIVWRPREGVEQGGVEYWLKSVLARVGADVRFILVASHADEGRQPELDIPHLQATYGECLRGFVSVDSKSGTGIERLKKLVGDAALEIPTTGQLWRRQWKVGRDQLLQEKKPQITLAQFGATAGRAGVASGEIALFATVLNDSGSVVYFPDDPSLNDQVILNPEWLSKAMSVVFEDRTIRDQGGVVRHRDLAELWSRADSSYSTSTHPYLLRMMERFDVSYRFDGEDRSLVAQLLPFGKDPSGFRSRAGALRLVCELKGDAPGLIPWLIVRHHRFSDGRAWRTGTYLFEPRDESEAMIELRGSELSVEVRGPYPALLFEVLRDSIEELLEKRWPGVEYVFMIPCPTPGCAGRLKLRTLIELKKRGVRSRHCDDCFAEHIIDTMLLGYFNDSGVDARLGAIEKELGSVRANTDVVREHGADLRAIKKMLSAEVDDCPRLFTLAPVDKSRWNPSRVWESRFQLTLWCEEPRSEHPVDPPYVFDRSREWFEKAAPYIRIVSRTLALTIPIAGGAIGMAADQSVSSQVMTMKGIADAVGLVGDGTPGIAHGGLSTATGAAHRFFRQFLFEIDESRRFAGLTQIVAPAGERVYLCQEHYRLYVPELPTMGT